MKKFKTLNLNKIIMKGNEACKINLTLDENYVLTVSLINGNNEVIDSKQVDFPVESMVVDAEQQGENLLLTLQNGNSITVSLSSLFGNIKFDELTYYEATGTFTEGEGVPTSFDEYEFGGNENTRIDPEDALEIGDGLRLYPAEGKTINDYSEKVFVVGYDENGNYVNDNGSGELYVSSGKNYLEITKGLFTDAVTRVLFSIYNDPTLTDFVLVRMNAVMSEEKIKVDELIEKTNPNIYKYSVTGTNNNEIYIPEEAPNGTKGVLILDSSHDVQVTLYGESDHLINCILAKPGDYISIEDIYEYGELQEVFYVAFRPSKKTDSQTPLSIIYAFVTDIKNESTAVQELINSAGGEQSSPFFIVTYEEESDDLVSDMTYAQIKANITAGKIPIAKFNDGNDVRFYNIERSNDYEGIVFSNLYVYEDGASALVSLIHKANSIEKLVQEIYGLEN